MSIANQPVAEMPLIEETPRGPYVRGTRISVYAVMDYIKANRSRAEILESLPILNAAQVQAVYDYIAQHNEEVECGYEAMARRCAALEAHYRQTQAERPTFPPDLSLKEKQQLLKQRLEELKQVA